MKSQLLITGPLSFSAASSLFVSLALLELDYPIELQLLGHLVPKDCQSQERTRNENNECESEVNLSNENNVAFPISFYLNDICTIFLG
jgi:hypothetical protein